MFIPGQLKRERAFEKTAEQNRFRLFSTRPRQLLLAASYVTRTSRKKQEQRRAAHCRAELILESKLAAFWQIPGILKNRAKRGAQKGSGLNEGNMALSWPRWTGMSRCHFQVFKMGTALSRRFVWYPSTAGLVQRKRIVRRQEHFKRTRATIQCVH